MTVFAGLLAVLVLLGGGAALVGAAKEKGRRTRKARQEKEVFRLAQQAGGCLTVADVVAGTSLTSDEADAMLEEMVKKGHATIQVTDSGGIVYEWLSMLPPPTKPDDAPADPPAQPAPPQTVEAENSPEPPVAVQTETQVNHLKTGMEGIASRFPKTLAASSFLSDRLNVLSSAYKNWLPKLVDRLDELTVESDEAALQAFQPILRDELAKYREHQQNSQFPDGEETDTQFKARMILKFSSGPMIQVLESAVREVRHWEAHKDTADAAATVQKLKALLTETEV